MTTFLQSTRVVDHQTDIEQFSDGEDAVIILWDGESRTIETYTRGTVDPLYVGPSMEAARGSLQLSTDEWNRLMSEPVEYLEYLEEI